MMPIGSAGRDALNCLGILKVGIHARFRVNKPGAQMIACSLGKMVVSGQEPSRGQGRHLNGKRNHHFAMIVEVIRIALSVAVDVGAIGIFGLGQK